MMKNQMSLLQYPAAAANAVVLLSLVLLMVAGDPARRRHPQGALSHGPRATRPRASTCSPPSSLLFVLFLYGPLSAILILSFQGPDGGLTFPMNGVSLHWFANLFEKQAVGDFGGSLPALADRSA